jgi:hypothetical protein
MSAQAVGVPISSRGIVVVPSHLDQPIGDLFWLDLVLSECGVDLLTFRKLARPALRAALNRMLFREIH